MYAKCVKCETTIHFGGDQRKIKEAIEQKEVVCRKCFKEEIDRRVLSIVNKICEEEEKAIRAIIEDESEVKKDETKDK